jgi:hypothetical protein
MNLSPLVGLALLAFPAVASAQGTLSPPAGDPAASMRTLTQLEPRRPLGTPGQLNTTPLVITAPGSYVLQGNLTVAGGDGIQIRADDVTLDLNGFTVTSSAATAEGCGIRLGGTTVTAHRARIRNGRLFSPGYTAEVDLAVTFTGAGFTNAIAPDHAGACTGVQLEELFVTGCQQGLDAGPDSTATDCVVRFLPGVGIRATTVRDCAVADTGDSGIVADNVIRCQSEPLCEGPAILAHTVTASTGRSTDVIAAPGNGIEATGTVTDSFGTTLAPLACGIKAADAIRCFGNGGTGIQVTHTARFCFGDGGAETAIVGPTLIACSNNFGSLPGTSMRYLMPGAAP